MASNNKQFGPENSSDFPDEMIRRFLLGGLRSSEQPAFEQRLLTDHVLARRVHLAELELADHYAYDRLNSAERELAAETFLLSADRERQVRVSRSLRDQFAPASASSFGASSYVTRLRPVFNVAHPAWRFAFAAVILLIVIGAAWLVIKEPRIASQITNRILPRRSPSPRAPREAGHANNTSTPEHQVVPGPMPVHDQTAAAPMIVSVALLPAASWPGDATAWIDLPKGEQDIVRLQLALKPDQSGPYQAELLTGDGQSLFSAASIKSADNGSAQVEFDVPARLLKTGNYQIRLGPDNAGAKENMVSYYFRAQ